MKKIDQTVILNNTSEWKKYQNVTFTIEKTHFIKFIRFTKMTRKNGLNLFI